MQKQHTTVTCDQCGGPTTACLNERHKTVVNNNDNRSDGPFGVLILLGDRPADLCPVCYNDIVRRSLTRKSDLPTSVTPTEAPLLESVARHIILSIRPDRKCPECKGSGRVHVSACVSGLETAGMSDCRHCENGICPVPCSHDHL
jgi:hypothetical protein